MIPMATLWYGFIIGIFLIIYVLWPRARKEQEELPDYRPVISTPVDKLFLQIANSYCPDCGKHTDWHEGPSGGMSTNIVCEAGHWFNVTPIIGTAERIKR